MLSAGVLVLATLLAGCAGPAAEPRNMAVAQRIDTLLPADLILFGEQHDAPEHQQLQRVFVEHLADRGRLAALVVEMAERGTSTAGLPRDASAADAMAALRWNDAGWPWERYRPVVMAAVARGVPVVGGNLPRADMRAAMRESAWDTYLPASAYTRQQAAIRDGHCNLLPESQIAPMVRVQLARDAAMAAVARSAVVPGKTVLLVAGNGHVVRALGIPAHLPPDVQVRSVVALAGGDAKKGNTVPAWTEGADLVWPTPPLPPRDHCAELTRQIRR